MQFAECLYYSEHTLILNASYWSLYVVKNTVSSQRKANMKWKYVDQVISEAAQLANAHSNLVLLSKGIITRDSRRLRI